MTLDVVAVPSADVDTDSQFAELLRHRGSVCFWKLVWEFSSLTQLTDSSQALIMSNMRSNSVNFGICTEEKSVTGIYDRFMELKYTSTYPIPIPVREICRDIA